MRLTTSAAALCCLFLIVSLSCQAISSKELISPALIKSFQNKQDEQAKRRFKSWLNLIKNNQEKTTKKKLTLVNDFFNQFKFRSDISFVGEADYWMTPVEFIENGAGDCEDFSIAKYFTLLALGLDMNKLRITYVKALELNQAHMVLAYYQTPGSDPLILDNLTPKIKRASDRSDLLPVYSFNGDGLWLNKIGQSNKVGSSSKLSKWQKLLKRMRQQRNNK